MSKKISLVLSFLCIYASSGWSQITLKTTTVDTTTVINNVDIPWEILWGPDNWIWMTERFGRVSRVNPENGQQDVLLDIKAEVYENGEAGLLGMALHPEFDLTPYVYLAFTYLDNGKVREKLVRYQYDGSALVLPFTLIDDIPGNNTHNGSRLLILSDKTILMTTGDAQNQSLPQNVNSLAGKVLRLNLDGSIPADNPIPNNPVWSWGHRNAQGLALSTNGKLYSSEHGPTTDDEINIIEKGGNYGWPDVHGFCDSPAEAAFCNDSSVIEPLVNWTPTIATSDLVWYQSTSIPEFTNTLLLAALKDKRIISLKLNSAGDQVLEQNEYFINVWGRIRDICVSPSGDLYLATNGQNWNNTSPFKHSIVKVSNSAALGIEKKNSPSIKHWPNPAKGVLNIQIPLDFKGNSLRITDLSGRLLKRTSLESTVFQLDISDLSSGLYLLQTEGGSVNLTERFIVD